MNGLVVELVRVIWGLQLIFPTSLFENITYASKHLKLNFHMTESKAGCSDFKETFMLVAVCFIFQLLNVIKDAYSL